MTFRLGFCCCATTDMRCAPPTASVRRPHGSFAYVTYAFEVWCCRPLLFLHVRREASLSERHTELALTYQPAPLFSWLSGMYEWIVDGISSLFVPRTGQKSAGWPRNGSSQLSAADTPDSRRPGKHIRPAKRNYQRSVYCRLRRNAAV